MTNKARKAKPVEMPQATSKSDQISSRPAGYGDDGQEEPTQEWKPNPLDNNDPKPLTRCTSPFVVQGDYGKGKKRGKIYLSIIKLKKHLSHFSIAPIAHYREAHFIAL